MFRRTIPLAVVAGAILFALAGPNSAAAPDRAASRTAVRSGNHPDFGRIVIDTTGKAGYHLKQDGDHVEVRFDSDMTLGNPPSPPRNVMALTTDGPTVDLTLAHGANCIPCASMAVLSSMPWIHQMCRTRDENPPDGIRRAPKPHPPPAVAAAPDPGEPAPRRPDCNPPTEHTQAAAPPTNPVGEPKPPAMTRRLVSQWNRNRKRPPRQSRSIQA